MIKLPFWIYYKKLQFSASDLMYQRGLLLYRSRDIDVKSTKKLVSPREVFGGFVERSAGPKEVM